VSLEIRRFLYLISYTDRSIWQAALILQLKPQNSDYVYLPGGLVLNVNKLLIVFISFTIILVTSLIILFYSNKKFDGIVRSSNETASVESDKKDASEVPDVSESEIVNDFFDKEFGGSDTNWQNQDNPMGFENGSIGGQPQPNGFGGGNGGMAPPPDGFGGGNGGMAPPPDGFGGGNGGMAPPPDGFGGGQGGSGGNMMVKLQPGIRLGTKDTGATIVNVMQDKLYITYDKNTSVYAYIAIIPEFDDSDLIDLQKIEGYAFCDKIIKENGDSAVTFSLEDLTDENGKYRLVAFPYDPNEKFKGYGWGSEYFSVDFTYFAPQGMQR